VSRALDDLPHNCRDSALKSKAARHTSTFLLRNRVRQVWV
jgi:hypothetical protein